MINKNFSLKDYTRTRVTLLYIHLKPVQTGWALFLWAMVDHHREVMFLEQSDWLLCWERDSVFYMREMLLSRSSCIHTALRVWPGVRPTRHQDVPSVSAPPLQQAHVSVLVSFRSDLTRTMTFPSGTASQVWEPTSPLWRSSALTPCLAACMSPGPWIGRKEPLTT